MKTIIYSAFAFLMSVMALTACSSDNVSGLALSGDCMVESFELDGTYTGVIDLSKRTIVADEDYQARHLEWRTG